jgi:Glu-tRNA(Gln) amidotransferase subunit E-like FAD-binding protein
MKGGDSMTQMQSQQFHQQSQWLASKNPLTIDAVVPDEQTAQQIVQEHTTDPAVREVTFRRDSDGTPHVRISLQPQAVSQFKDKLQRIGESVQRSYQSVGYGSQ